MSARAQNANINLRGKIYGDAKTNSMCMLTLLFQHGLKFLFDYINRMDFLRIFLPGLKPSPCNRHFNFKRISFRTQAEISSRLARLEFANVITPNTKSLFSRSAFSRSAFSRHPVTSSQWNCRGKRKLCKG